MALDEKKLKEAVQSLHKHKVKFSQSYDLLVSLKDLNLKNPDDQVEFFTQLPVSPGKKISVCALVGPEMVDEAKSAMDKVVRQSEFGKLQKTDVKKLAKEYDYFVGQANIMPKIAQSFGRVLGPKGKMPNPKAGCIVPPKAPLKPLVDRLQKTVKISARKIPNIQIRVASQAMKEEEVVKNVLTVYDQIVHHLPREENNVRSVFLKVTMSAPVKLK
ncbi:hypothetical protein GOV11_02170 [Candidatus Woesearchaeota archaeon]|nr:hypothetical protein [Candidatus Woesearchaeota archaeon]